MSAELEPTAGDAIEPSAIYGPDDWRPYTGPPIDHDQVIRDILRAAGREERRKAYERRPVGVWLDDADPGERATFRYDTGEAEYYDPLNVRERGIPDEYAYTANFFSPAMREAQRHLRVRMAFGGSIIDPADIAGITGTGA